jgi:hypothetical protein
MNAPLCKRGCEAKAVYARRFLVAGLAFLAFCTTLIATRWGIGLSPDSLVYIGVARSLLEGNGVTYLNDVGELAPVNHYPPLYPSMIAGLALTGMDPLIAAKWMNAFFFAANVVLVSLVALASTLSYGASLTAALLVFTSFPMVQIHSMAWSEPVFVLFGFSGLFLLASYLQGARRGLLYASASAIAVSCLARYAGIAFVWTGVLGIFLPAPRQGKKRLADAFVFSMLSLLPLMAWVCRSLWLAGSAANRTFGFHPPTGDDLITALNSLCLWVFPAGILAAPVWMRLAALGMGLLLVLRFTGQKTLPTARSYRLAAIFLFAYGIFIFVARCFFDSAISFDTRILAPAYVAAMIVVVSIMAQWIKNTPSSGLWRARLVLAVFVVAVTAIQTTKSVGWWKHAYANGIGYTGLVWRNSETLRFVNTVDPAAPIFTNVPDVIYMLTGRRTNMIPRKVDPKSRIPNKRYDSEIAHMKERLKQRNGVVAYFYAPQRLWYLPSASELQTDAGLRLIAQKMDGYIYQPDRSG